MAEPTSGDEPIEPVEPLEPLEPTAAGVGESDPDFLAVQAANQAFYDAHERRDFEAMDAIWEHSDRVICVHPGWPILRGWSAVGMSWRQIFSGAGRNQFLLTNVSISVDGELAWVTLEENLVDTGNMSAVAATNIYTRTPDGWRLINHHASPILATA